MSCQVHLQINQSGAWRTALTFDLDTTDVERFQKAAADLVSIAHPNGNTKLRLATADGSQRALLRWHALTGWKDA